jgi:hypothetical protein
MIQRRLDSDIVDLRIEDFFEIVRVHGSESYCPGPLILTADS